MMRRACIGLLAAWALIAALAAAAPATAAPVLARDAADAQPAAPAAGFMEARTVLALYDSREHKNVRTSMAQRYAAMPLQHLGLKLRFWDLAQGLPPVEQFEDVRGVLAWIYDGRPPGARAYLEWATSVIDAGYRLALMGNITGALSESDDAATFEAARALLARLGVALGDRFVGAPYRAQYPVYDRDFAGFEWDPAIDPIPFQESGLIPGSGATARLAADAGGPTAEKGVLVVTGPNGGFVQSGYDIRLSTMDNRTRWILNPFNFFQAAFGVADMPKPDVTTLVGRRIYYSHIDGDGWRSLSLDEAYRDHPTPAAEVVFEQAIQAYPDLPVTVAPIAADLDLRWLGSVAAQEAATRIFAAPQVEVAHHTYTHPFAWEFFEQYDRKIELEVAGSVGFGRLQGAAKQPISPYDPLLGYDSARAYAQEPFDLHLEIVGARDFVSQFAPEDKPANLVQWSGNTRPYAAAIAIADRNGILNINGGDSRYDPEYPTVASVAGVGIEFEGVRQIFASASNENTYTELWTRRFFGFRYLNETVQRTNAPRRLLPHNVYYHMYSGARTAALAALVQNLEIARASELAPIRTTDYVRIAHGYFDARLERLGPDAWRIHDRGALQTIRFDDPGQMVDYRRSHGAIGHRVVNRSLYVALDAGVAAPTVALQPAGPVESVYLEQARWPVRDLRIGENGFSLHAHGYGEGVFVWRGLSEGVYRIAATARGQTVWQGEATADATGALAFTVPSDAIDGLDIAVVRRSFAQAGER